VSSKTIKNIYYLYSINHKSFILSHSDLDELSIIRMCLTSKHPMAIFKSTTKLPLPIDENSLKGAIRSSSIVLNISLPFELDITELTTRQQTKYIKKLTRLAELVKQVVIKTEKWINLQSDGFNFAHAATDQFQSKIEDLVRTVIGNNDIIDKLEEDTNDFRYNNTKKLSSMIYQECLLATDVVDLNIRLMIIDKKYKCIPWII